MLTAALDVGGANIKAAGPCGCFVRPFELWRRPGELAAELGTVLERLGPLDVLGVTMTGELCDCFATRADGVRSILESVRTASESARLSPRELRVWRVDGRLAGIDDALSDPVPAAAANWLALASFAGRFAPVGRALLADVGSTTTDLVPLEDGRPTAAGRTDTERLLAGELVYTGAARTPIAAVVGQLPHGTSFCPVASELFATTLDAGLILGLVPESTESAGTADGRPATKAFARDRLARMICADRQTFSEEDAVLAARHVLAEQVRRIRAAAGQVMERAGGLPGTLVLSGSGEFLARRALDFPAARVVSLAAELGPEASAAAPAYALARLVEEERR